MMTGYAPKTGFLRPSMFMPVLVEAAKLAVKRQTSGDVHYVVDGRVTNWQSEPPKQAAA
jgi:hypothetical protein